MYEERPAGYELGITIERVVDWEDRIAAYSQEIKNMYYLAFDKIKEVDEMLVDTSLNWQVQQDSKKKGSEIYCDFVAAAKSGHPAMRCWTYTDFDPLTTARAYTNPELRMQYDRNVAECRIIE